MGRGRSEKSLVSFAQGEWSPRLHSRADLQKAASACRVMENMIAETYGIARRRPGTRFVASIGVPQPISSDQITFEARRRGFGTEFSTDPAEVSGYPEYIPSLPPRYYRRKQNYGESVSDAYTSGCATFTHTITCTHDGWCQLDDAGDETSGGTDTCDGSVQNTGCSTPAPDCTRGVVTTATTKTSYPIAACCTVGGGELIAQRDTFTQTLLLEDTELAAITRRMVGLDWSDWATATSSNSLATWELRGAAQTEFDYSEAQYRGSITGLIPGNPYTIRIPVYRRSFGTGSFELFDTLTTVVDADGAGEITIPETYTPNLAGFDTYVLEPVVTSTVP